MLLLVRFSSEAKGSLASKNSAPIAVLVHPSIPLLSAASSASRAGSDTLEERLPGCQPQTGHCKHMDAHALNQSIKEEEARAVKADGLFLSMNNFI